MTPTRSFLFLIAGLLVWSGLVLSIDTGHFGLFQDDGLYLTAARSLRDGQGFGLPSRPGEPPPKYPIGLPATLALVLRLDPSPPSLTHEIAVSRGLVVLAGWGFFLASHAWLRRIRVRPGLACALTLATAFLYVVSIQVAATLMADLPFAAVTYLLLARFAARPANLAGEPPVGWRRSAINGVLAGFGFLLRTNGITLIAASLVAAYLDARGRKADRALHRRIRWSPLVGCVVGVVLVVVPATWYAGRHPRVIASNSYLVEMQAGWSSPSAGLGIVAQNLRSIVLEFPTRVIASPVCQIEAVVRTFRQHPTAGWLVYGAGSAVVAVGLFSLIRSSRPRDLPVWVHLVGTLIIFAVWPWNSILDRFLLTLIPMVFLAFVRGCAVLLRAVPALRADRAARGRLVRVTLAVVLFCNGAVVIQAVRYFHTHDGHWYDFPSPVDLGQAFQLIRAQTETDAVIASAFPEMVYLHTDRVSVPIFEDEAAMLGRFGDVSRLKLWHQMVRGRPFYLLHRSAEENANHADDTQIAALTAPGSGLSTRLVARTPGGRYRVSRLVLDPG